MEGLWIRLRQLVPEEIVLGEKRRRYTLASVWFATSLALAVFLPNIGIVISALGELAAIFIFVFPGEKDRISRFVHRYVYPSFVDCPELTTSVRQPKTLSSLLQDFVSFNCS